MKRRKMVEMDAQYMKRNADLMKIEKKREQEKKILSQMIQIYCHGNHNTHGKNVLCEKCQSLKEFAMKRTDKCPFMATKTFCSACKVHCYTKERKQDIKKVMRYAGPRMMLYHPLAAIRHGLVTIQSSVLRKQERKKKKDSI